MKWMFVYLFVLQACSSMDTSSIEKFSKSSSELNRATESVLSAATSKVREEEIETVSANPNSKLGPYYITTQGQTWKLDPKPVYMEFARHKAVLVEMNKSFENYLELLLALSGSKITDTEDLVTAVKKVNHPEYGLVSSAAIKSFETFMKSKQEKHLRKAIKSNQANVEAFAKRASELVQVIREMYRKSYVRAFTAYSRKWKDVNRNSVLRDVFDLNDAFIQDINGFQQIIAGYEQLPVQHENIGKKTPDKKLSQKLKDLSEEIKSVQKMKSELEAEKKK